MTRTLPSADDESESGTRDWMDGRALATDLGGGGDARSVARASKGKYYMIYDKRMMHMMAIKVVKVAHAHLPLGRSQC